ncbi:MAG: oligopeptide/dipeptide ABC transporter ATP-binding protein [Nitrososphaerales archaeon]
MSQVQLVNSSDSGDSRAPLLKVTDLSVRFKSQSGTFRVKKSTIKAVDGISFSVSKSEAVAVVGESGCGKTTLARCILGLVEPTSGSIIIDGQDVTKIKQKNMREYRRDVQIIYQDPFESLTPRLNVYDTVAMPLRELLGMKDNDEITAKVRKLLEEVGLDPSEIMYRYPHQLSGGQRQRVNIARALAPSPKLLVADEPTTMLDAAQRMNMLYLLLELKEKRNLTLLFITHDLASAHMLCKRTLVMYLGKLVEEGDTDVVLSKPKHPYVELILGALPSLKEKNPYENLKLTWIEDSSNLGTGCVFEPRCKYRTQICKEQEPPLTKKAENDYAACHHPLNM